VAWLLQPGRVRGATATKYYGGMQGGCRNARARHAGAHDEEEYGPHKVRQMQAIPGGVVHPVPPGATHVQRVHKHHCTGKVAPTSMGT